jgi:NAD(P)-dependent dehydrogenase (short-subunit alcohol dehydrogenase family)
MRRGPRQPSLGSHGCSVASGSVAGVTTAIITGCSSGIGRATAQELTRRGFEVTATARRPETLVDLDVARTLALDVDSDESVAAVAAELGTVDVLVNNAGYGLDGAVETVPLADVRKMFETNFFGAARMIKAFLPGMREQGSGAIVSLSSVAGIAAGPLAGFYSASKFALEAMCEALKLEVGHFGVRVVLIEPGSIATNFGANLVDYREEPGPYLPLAEQWQIASEKLSGGADPPGPELVATAIADALEQANPPLRVPVGQDAELVAATRQGMSYEQFEATMRQALGVDW